MISVICVYNDEETFNSFLLKSLQNQSVGYELIALDNTKGVFESAAQALNYGAGQTKSNSKYLMFVHQDIDLCSNEWLKNAEKILGSITNLGIAGVAGIPEEKKVLITNIKHGKHMYSPGKYHLKDRLQVQTLDECLVLIPRSVFNRLKFDEETCNGWHLYTVDYCLGVKELNLGVFVIPMFLHHRSLGSRNIIYFKALKKVLNKHKDFYKKIFTTCGCWSTRTPLLLQMSHFFVNEGVHTFLKMLMSWGLVPEFFQRKRRKREKQRLKNIGW